MKFLRLGLAVLALGGLLGASMPARGRLPDWHGWRKSGSTLVQHSGWQLPATQAAAMSEYGLVAIERDSYLHRGSHMQVDGFHFHDVAGAYGAFTYYRPSRFQPLKLGTAGELAVASGNEVLFARGTWLIRIHAPGAAPSLAQVRAFAAALPVEPAWSAELPDLPQVLPLDYRVAGSLHFSEGPATFATFCSWLPASQVGFQFSAETAQATYNLPGRPPGAQLLVISYPTPQMARTRLAGLARASGASVRRSGPYLVLVRGLSAAQATPLLNSVNYEPVLIRVPPKYLGLEGLPSLIVNVFLLVALVLGLSVLLGVITGGTSAMLERYGPERFRRLRAHGLIGLHLDGNEVEIPGRRHG
ncbi:MAG: DUF6599 family protein [Terriglobales bacterium]